MDLRLAWQYERRLRVPNSFLAARISAFQQKKHRNELIESGSLCGNKSHLHFNTNQYWSIKPATHRHTHTSVTIGNSSKRRISTSWNFSYDYRRLWIDSHHWSNPTVDYCYCLILQKVSVLALREHIDSRIEGNYRFRQVYGASDPLCFPPHIDLWTNLQQKCNDMKILSKIIECGSSSTHMENVSFTDEEKERYLHILNVLYQFSLTCNYII